MRCGNTRCSSMIGTALLYVLRPLSWYLTSLFTDSSSEKLPPASVNGKKVLDGGASSTLNPTQCQTTPLDQQSSATEEPDGQKEDEERPGANLIDEAAAGKVEEPPSVRDNEDGAEDPRHDEEELEGRNMSSARRNLEDGCVASAGGMSSEQELGLLLKCMQMDRPTFAGRKADTTARLEEHADVPRGPGPVGGVRCPLWIPPPMSYDPVWEPRAPFEAEWRVWEEQEERPRAEVALPLAKATLDFTVMSYNILADDLLMANMELYTHCPPEVLEWSYRSALVLEEILRWAPDILCLQEVQESHYRTHIYPALNQRGYACVYKQRTGSKTDGCATCYRASGFTEVSVTPLEYFRPETKVLDRHNVGLVLLLRPVATSRSEVTLMGPPLCVANTHLLFNPRRGDVKLAQLAVMLAEIDRVVGSCEANGELCNVVLCGDFNSVPHSPLYELIATGGLYFQDLPAWMISGQEDLSHRVHCHRLCAPLWPSCLGISHDCRYQTRDRTLKSHRDTPDAGKRQYSHHFLLQLRFTPAACVRPAGLELIPGVTDNTPDATRDYHQLLYNKSFGPSLHHGLDLKSAYQHILPGSAGPEVTTLHSQVGATVDYIFYNPRRISRSDGKAASTVTRTGLRLIGSLSLLSEDVLWSLKGLPNYTFPSDHLSLLAKFQMDLDTA